MNKNNNVPGYNPYFDDGAADERVTSDYETMNRYVDTSGFGDSYEAKGMPNNIIYPEEVALQRQTSSKRLLEKETMDAREDSMKQLTRGDSKKKIQTLNKLEFPNSSETKRPVTRFQKFQAWMINEGKFHRLKHNVTQIYIMHEIKSQI